MTYPIKPDFRIERRGRPRKAGPRYPNNELKDAKWPPDYGTPELQLKRQMMNPMKGMTL